MPSHLMKRLLPLLAVACMAAASPPASSIEQEVAGVRLPSVVQVGEKLLLLNGMGLRTRTVFKVKVYVAGLYLEKRSTDAAAVIASDQPKRVELVFLRDLDRAQITDAIGEGFARNSKDKSGALKPRLEKLKGFIPDVKEQDRLVITYLPGKGTSVAVRGTEKGVLEGKDFADALFAVWLGNDPVDADLKSALLRH